MTAATDEAAFLAAILENPHDDTPRLALADWLDEHDAAETCGACDGKPEFDAGGTWWRCEACGGTGRVGNGYAERAEFIRVQCELARREHHAVCVSMCEPPEFEGCQQRAERKRESELFAAGLCRWMYGQVVPNAAYRLEGQAGVDGVPTLCFSRGFVSKLVCPAAAFTADLARAVWSRQPCVSVALSDREPRVCAESGRCGWYSYVMARMTDPDDLPQPIWSLLRGYWSDVGSRWRYYADRQTADRALSDACVAYGRSLAGLPARG